MKENTTLGKSVKTFVWVVVANAAVAGLTYITGHTDLYNPLWVSVANVGLVILKNVADPNVKNY